MEGIKSQNSGVLARVIGGIVAIGALSGGQANAGTTDLPPIIVVAPAPNPDGSWSLGGGSGGFGGGDTAARDAWVDAHSRGAPPLTCADVNQGWPSSCTSRPPPFVSDGCTMVPDFAFSDPSLEPIFTPACGKHDECYSTYYGPSRASCNAALLTGLVRTCHSHFSVDPFDKYHNPIKWEEDLAQRALCDAQADTYYAGLTVGATALYSKHLFNLDRKVAACKNAYALNDRMGCGRG